MKYVIFIICVLALTACGPENNTQKKTPVTVTQPTGYPVPHKPINKTNLIIQQNPDCWLGIPGATCNPGTRTFLGE